MATVRVPATSANLGSGFDALGLALALSANVSVSLEPHEEHGHSLAPMVAAAARAAYREAGQPEPAELRVVWEDMDPERPIPIARGLGASAAARAAGIVAANALMGKPLTDDQLLTVGAELEGHADNIAPALFGGMQITVRDEDAWLRLRVPLASGLKIVLYIPDLEMPTRESRARLPQRLSREDAVFNIGRAALLVAALEQGKWDMLDAATQDRLHQNSRAELFPALDDIIDAAKDAGAHGAYLSGAGSAIAAFTTEDEERVARLMQQAAVGRGFSGRSLITEPSTAGAELLDS
ncbi:MAG: homoserine kinase [Chloroflexi bacterium]|nr:homoserine kinase [Chloroflexota bacterium]MCI0890032.1 homoserine kinase [Chloroflexota bacterium]